MTLAGVPALVIGGLMNARVPQRANRGEQPGGILHGRLVDGADRPVAGAEVLAFPVDAESTADALTSTRADAKGEFALEVPPLTGAYFVGAGGGEWVRAGREASFLDRRGKIVEPRALELKLEPGAVLEFEFVDDEDGAAAPTSGDWVLEATTRERRLFGLVSTSYRRHGRWQGGRLEIDGLPPSRGTLTLDLDSGGSVRLELDLALGRHREVLRVPYDR